METGMPAVCPDRRRRRLSGGPKSATRIHPCAQARSRPAAAIVVTVTSSALETSLSELLASACAEHQVPGAAVGVLHEGTEYFACHGVTSVTDPLPVTPGTLFLIGSTSKTLTATALMALADQGKVRLDDRLAGHLPGLPVTDAAARAAVTVGQLLDHTAGWTGDVETESGWGDDALAAALPELLGQAAQITPPGQVMSYNNTSFVVAGHLLATLAGEPFEAAVRRLVLDPLGLASTWYFPWEVATRRVAVGHAPGPDGQRPVPPWPVQRWLAPAGGVISTAADQLRYARFQLDGSCPGTPPVTASTRLLMRQQRVSAAGPLDGVGVSWLLRRYGGLDLVEHGGNVSNLHVSAFAMVPSHQLAVTTLTNAAGGGIVGREVLEHVLERLTGHRQPPAPVPQAMDPGLAAEYTGHYRAGQWDLDVSPAGDGLAVALRLRADWGEVADAVRETLEGEPERLVLTGPDTVAAADRPAFPVGDFIRDGTGAVRYFRYKMRLSAREP
jgi:CubicO group peptidase (beta-lactamase class C family)